MNREQAGHLLDAYAEMENYGDHEASNALREVILDAMTSYRTQTVPAITSAPGISTWPAVGNRNVVTCETGGAL